MTLTTAPPPVTRTAPRTEPVPVTAVPPPIHTVPPVIDGPVPELEQRADEPAQASVSDPLDRSAIASDPGGSAGRSAFRFDPSSGTVLVVAVVLVSVVAVASFTVSFAGLLSVASWASIPAFIRPLVPVAIDATQLVYTLTAVIQKTRGQWTWFSWLAITVFTAVSVAANAAHVLAPQFVAGAEWNGWTAQDLAGAAICALMPVALFFATHTVVGIVTGTDARTADPVRSAPHVPDEPSEPEHETAGAFHRAEGAAPNATNRDGGTNRTAAPMPRSVPTDSADRAATTVRPVDPGEVLALHARGFSYARIALQLRTNKTRVGRIVRSKTSAVDDCAPGAVKEEE